MANRTDPLISQVSGSDPQNLMEYLTRQRIYDSRYWKETCFGLTVQDVLEESTQHRRRQRSSTTDDGTVPPRGPVAIGHLQFLALVLKLLQLHPEPEVITETFVDQTQFKYTRALGALYLRLTGRPADIYMTLEALYQDKRKVAVCSTMTTTLSSSSASSSLVAGYMDDYIHQLLTETSVAGITLPRLPLRRALQEAGYLPYEEGDDDEHDDDEEEEDRHCRRIHRPTALKEKIMQHGGALPYLKYKALVEQCPAAKQLWDDKYSQYDDDGGGGDTIHNPSSALPTGTTKDNEATTDNSRKKRRLEQEGQQQRPSQNHHSKSSGDKKEQKKAKMMNRLFKKSASTTNNDKTSSSNDNSNTTMTAVSTTPAATQQEDRESTEYWNQERAKLGLAPLKE